MELSSDEDQHLHGLSAKKKKPIISSSSSDDEVCSSRLKTPKDRSNSLVTGSTRSSERIKKRRNRTFSLPSRADRWKDIPSEKYTEKELRKLTPQKLINNFTKENHRYNYDPVYTSGEESMEEFINDASESDSSDTDSDRPSRRKKPHRKVKHFHPRIVKESSSDSDENRVSDTDSDVGLKLVRKSVKRNSKCIESESDDEDKQKTDKVPRACKNLGKDFEDKIEEENEDSDSDIPVVDRSRVGIIESDKEDDETETQTKIKRIGTGGSDIDKDGECSAFESADGRLDIDIDKSRDGVQDSLNGTCNDKTTACKAGTSLNDSGIMNDMKSKLSDTGVLGDKIELKGASSNTSDEESDNSESQTVTSSESDIEVNSDRSRVIMVKKKRKTEKLFEQFKAAREQKLQRDAKRRQSETCTEVKDKPF